MTRNWSDPARQATPEVLAANEQRREADRAFFVSFLAEWLQKNFQVPVELSLTAAEDFASQLEKVA